MKSNHEDPSWEPGFDPGPDDDSVGTTNDGRKLFLKVCDYCDEEAECVKLENGVDYECLDCLNSSSYIDWEDAQTRRAENGWRDA